MTQQPDISDEAILKATGRTWREWLGLLSAAGMAQRTREEILVSLREEHGVPSWWQQAIANQFEQSIGRVSKDETDDGFLATVSRTLDLPAEKIFEAWTDDAKRATWLRRADFQPDTIRPPDTVRGKWMPDGTQVDVDISDAGEGRCRLTVQHRKLANAELVERMRAFWERSLERMAAGAGK